MTLQIICVTFPALTALLLILEKKYEKLKKITITSILLTIFFNIFFIISSNTEKNEYKNIIKGLKEKINLLGNQLEKNKKIILYSSSDEENIFEGTFEGIITFTKKISSQEVNVALDSLFTYADIELKLDNGVENFNGNISSSYFRRLKEIREKEEVVSSRVIRSILKNGSPVPILKNGRPVPSFIIEKRVKINELCYLFSIKTGGLQLFSKNGIPYKHESSNKNSFIVDNLPFDKNKALRYNVESVVFIKQFIK